MLSSSAWLTDVTTPSWRALPAMLRSYWLLRFEGLSRAPQGWWFKSSLRQQCGSGHGVWMEARRLVQISRRENWSESLLRQSVGCRGRRWVHENPSGVRLWKASPAEFLQRVSSWGPLLACCGCVVCVLELVSESPELCLEAHPSSSAVPALWARAERGKGRKRKGRERGQGLA